MKKNISINISGIIFNIEEDGYDRLKRYLDEIKRYFATYDDTGEIAADIENRVAEIFLTKLNPHKQVITALDVDSLILQMGNVRDFEAIEEPEETTYNHSYEHTYTGSGSTGAGAASATATAGSRRLYRDGSRKIIGGVAAGIAHYFRIDAFWIRLLFLIILLDLFISFSFSSALLIGYIILWIVVPERFDLAEDRKMKKMFRNPDDKVIGGVASGLAAYFGVDPTLIRILFILLIFLGGTGLIAYLVLWVITPEAITLTDRMQMQGEPVTLSNIEHNIKKNLNVKEGEENAVVKVLLFPFRLLSAIFSGAGRSLSPLIKFLGDAIRVIAGVALILMGFFFLLSLIAGFSFAGGFFPEVYLDLFDLRFPAMIASETVPTITLVAGFISLFIPGLAAILLGIAIIAKRWLLNTAASWIIFALWVISLITLAVTIPALVADFKERNYYETETTFMADSTEAMFLVLQNEDNMDADDVDLTIKAGSGNELRMTQRFYARGRTENAALAMAKQTRYEVDQQGDTLLLSHHLELPDEVPYRAQELDITLYMPVGQKFKMDYSLRRILSYTLTPAGLNVSDLRGNPTFVFNEDEELICLDCPEREEEWRQHSGNEEWRGQETYEGAGGDFIREINARDFQEVSVGDDYEVIFTQSPNYSVRLAGDEDAVNTVEFEQNGNSISFKNSMSFFDSNNGKVRIFISLPELRELDMGGSSEARLESWKAPQMTVDQSGSSEVWLEGKIDQLSVDMSGSSELELRGRGEMLEADLSGSSTLKALEFPVREATINQSGSSEAKVTPGQRLEVNASGGSQTSYTGNPQTRINKSGGADVDKLD
ncbi:PspC domain-containing protein [Nafulsella turpanensis]|uniref:PspC domain-containing protein n=1 Tax=Nafulsella turpanensis TaxID=1265690 RepID=UPI00034956AF|nr:PspC domain-containing protein [Nafulsella turpanensis]